MRCAIAWTLYRIGDAWCRLAVRRGPGYYFEWPYRVYNRIMLWSIDMQGSGHGGPWSPATLREKTSHEI